MAEADFGFTHKLTQAILLAENIKEAPFFIKLWSHGKFCCCPSVRLCQPRPVRGGIVLKTVSSSAYHLYCHWPSGCGVACWIQESFTALVHLDFNFFTLHLASNSVIQFSSWSFLVCFINWFPINLFVSLYPEMHWYMGTTSVSSYLPCWYWAYLKIRLHSPVTVAHDMWKKVF